MRNNGAVVAVLVYSIFGALILPVAAYASSYWSTASFSHDLRGITRSYAGSTLRISMNATSYNERKGNGLTFNVSAYRDKPWPIPDAFIPAKAVFRRAGGGSAKWSTGSGKYYFYFQKKEDGATVHSDSIHMYN